MKPNTILALQAALITLQMINAGLTTIPGVPPTVTMMVAAVVGGLQFYMQRVGNQSEPPKPPEK